MEGGRAGPVPAGFTVRAMEQGGTHSVQSVFTLPRATFFSLLYLAFKKTVHFPFMLKVLTGTEGAFLS